MNIYELQLYIANVITNHCIVLWDTIYNITQQAYNVYESFLVMHARLQ